MVIGKQTYGGHFRSTPPTSNAPKPKSYHEIAIASARHYPRPMNELDSVWSQMLASAIENANAAGRADIVEYLTLRAANDLLRNTGIDWLFDSFTALAMEETPFRPSLAVERVEPHNFPYRGANAVGTLLSIRQGVRCLSVEAGWTRTPTDGFMRGGALAAARIRHFGMSEANSELALLKTDGGPEWMALVGDVAGQPFRVEDIRRHFAVFLG